MMAKVERKQKRVEPAGILANIESPRAYRLAAEIAAASPRVEGLQVGYGISSSRSTSTATTRT
jgi:citrate lyase subunit beta/citryl-CoA lyase